MARLRVHSFSVSLDGFGAAPDQSRDDPLGVGGLRLHEWAFATERFREEYGGDGTGTGVDDRILREADENIGATVMGRNMFGPVRGPWPADDDWRGWWGEDPPYHHDVFVLTHHARPPLAMVGGTTFHFVTDGLDAAVARAFDAADGRDVRLGGGVSTVQDALRRGLVDELNLAVVPVLLGAGERLFDDGVPEPVGYRCTRLLASEAVVHVRMERIAQAADDGTVPPPG
ncbi:MAG: dihydrofolate reductase family protein [Microbacterium sp.]|nr:dihydrofolate reductase family protein [Microbacterium sp.]